MYSNFSNRPFKILTSCYHLLFSCIDETHAPTNKKSDFLNSRNLKPCNFCKNPIKKYDPKSMHFLPNMVKERKNYTCYFGEKIFCSSLTITITEKQHITDTVK